MVSSRKKITAITIALLMAFSVVGAGAYTSFTANRQVTMDVVKDDNSGILSLTPDPDATLVTLNSSGAMTIDVTNNGASGINAESRMKIGDNSSATAADKVHAFNITNNDGASRSVTLDYAVTGTDGEAADNVKFIVYDPDAGTEDAYVSEETGSSSVSLASGETVSVVVVVESGSDTQDLSGTLTVSAS